MSELGETYAAWNEQKKKKKEQNLYYALEMLNYLSIDYESKNDGVHLIIRYKNFIIDYWPTTGKFSNRLTKKTGRGIFNLLQHIGIQLTTKSQVKCSDTIIIDFNFLVKNYDLPLFNNRLINISVKAEPKNSYVALSDEHISGERLYINFNKATTDKIQLYVYLNEPEKGQDFRLLENIYVELNNKNNEKYFFKVNSFEETTIINIVDLIKIEGEWFFAPKNQSY